MSTCGSSPCVVIRSATPVQFGGRGMTDPLPLNPGQAPVFSLGGEPNKAPSSKTWPRTHWSTCPTTLLLPRRETKRVPRIHPSRLGLKERGKPRTREAIGAGEPRRPNCLGCPKVGGSGGGGSRPVPALVRGGGGGGERRQYLLRRRGPWTPSREAAALMVLIVWIPGSVPAPRYICPPRLGQATQAASIWPFLSSRREGSISPGS